MSIILSAIFNVIVMLLICYLFNLIGQIANNKFFNKRFKYVMPIGFAWFIATFEILSFPFILVQTRFSLFLLFFTGFAILWLIYINLNRKYISFKIKISDKPYVELILMMVATILVLKSTVYSDSWLYSAMITSTIENNLIFSHNGTLSNVQLTIMHHRFESYYLWQAVVAMTFLGNYLVALVTEYKIFDGLILIFSFMEMGHQFKLSKLKSAMLALSIFFILSGDATYSVFQTTEPPVQLLQISTGTAVFHYLFIPFMLIYLFIQNKLNYKQKNIYLLTMITAFCAVTNTFYYTVPLFLIAILTVKHLFYGKKDNQVVLAFMYTWMLIFASFLGYKTMDLTLVILFIIAYIIVTKLILFIYKKLSVKFIKVSTVILYIGYGIVGLLLFNPLTFYTGDFNVDKQALRIYNGYINYLNGDIIEIILPIVILVVSSIALIFIFANRNKYNFITKYILVYAVLFLNPFALTMYRLIGIQPVISRIFVTSFIGYVIMIYLFEHSSKHWLKFILIVWISISAYSSLKSVNGTYSHKKAQMNEIKNGIDQLAFYDYDPNSFVVFDNLDAEVDLAVYYAGLNKLVVLDPSLSWSPSVDSCDQLYTNQEFGLNYSHCYTIYDKQKAEDLTYVYETENHYVYKNF